MSRPLPVVRRRRAVGWAIGGVAVLAAFALLVILTSLIPSGTRNTTDSLDNPGHTGARALAQVLRANGITVSQATSLDGAIAAAKKGTTLAVVLPSSLSQAATTQIAHAGADFVLIVADNQTGDVSDTMSALTGDQVAYEPWYNSGGSVAANCDDPDAQAAGSVTVSMGGLDTSAVSCFVGDSSAQYADVHLAAHRVTALASDEFVQNGTVADDGNAALALRTLGRHATLTWYLPRAADMAGASSGDSTGMDVWALFPGWAPPVLALALVAAGAAAVWRGRRFGKLVPEALPVAVPASEAASGLGRLYRQSKARGHAAAALRAATVSRMAVRLGIPPSSPPYLVVTRIADAVHAEPVALHPLLYGPAPATDDDLVRLAHDLAHLERTLH